MWQVLNDCALSNKNLGNTVAVAVLRESASEFTIDHGKKDCGISILP